jgi:hypothetical protein
MPELIKLSEAVKIFNDDHDVEKLISTIDRLIEAAEKENKEDAGNEGN